MGKSQVAGDPQGTREYSIDRHCFNDTKQFACEWTQALYGLELLGQFDLGQRRWV